MYLGISNATLAASYHNDTLSIEEQQQFLYYFYEAERLIQLNRIAEARPLVEFCYAINPQDATINNHLGLYAQADSLTDIAAKYFQRAYELNPKDYWYNHTVLMLQSEDKHRQAQALRQMEELTQKDRMNGELHTILQRAYILQKDYRSALRIQDQLDSINGYDGISAMQRYRLYASMKDVEGAIYEIERYLELDAENYQFQVFRMQLYEQTHQPSEKMITAYEAVLRLDPRNTVVMNNLAWHLCISSTDLIRAEELSRITIMREPSNPIYLDTYAWIMYQLGDCDSATFFIERAFQNMKDETDKEIRMHYKTIKKKCK